MASELAKGWDAHHVMPQKYVREFANIGINISDSQYMVLWKQVTGDPNSHRKLAKQYNDDWAAWFITFDGKPSPTRSQILQQAQFMFTKYSDKYNAPAVKVDFSN